MLITLPDTEDIQRPLELLSLAVGQRSLRKVEQIKTNACSSNFSRNMAMKWE